MTSRIGQSAERERLALLMDDRRRELRLTWDQVAAAAGVNRETLRLIRQGDGQIRPLTKDGIEDALQWQRDSIDAILAGGDPTPIGQKPAPQPKPESPPTLEELRDMVRKSAAENERLKARMAALEERLRPAIGEKAVDQALRPHGDSEHRSAS